MRLKLPESIMAALATIHSSDTYEMYKRDALEEAGYRESDLVSPEVWQILRDGRNKSTVTHLKQFEIK